MKHFEQKKEFHHVALWSAAALTASIAVGLLYLLYENVKDSDWFPQEWSLFVERYPTLVAVAGGIALWLLFAMLFYQRGAFSDQQASMHGWDALDKSDQAQTSYAKPVRAKRGKLAPMEVDLQYARRICTGDLLLGPDTISFICYFDQNATQAHAKKAIASQFGPLGMLVHNLLTNSSGSKRKKRIQAARAQLQGLSLQAQIAQNQYSFIHNIAEITKISKTSWSGKHILIKDTKYTILQIDTDDWQTIETWSGQHKIDTEGF